MYFILINHLSAQYLSPTYYGSKERSCKCCVNRNASCWRAWNIIAALCCRSENYHHVKNNNNSKVTLSDITLTLNITLSSPTQLNCDDTIALQLTLSLTLKSYRDRKRPKVPKWRHKCCVNGMILQLISVSVIVELLQFSFFNFIFICF